ncbi:SHD1-domain-containing protein [Tuber magnatum]|uniref:SHD1-domain-containing protein n=1 Tax=Tuber magnatum TaxID=42249 RepID=A0A317SQI2_9PEZI|nr:SHD1-domain-containing protein [Tuber magnatum]
MPSLDFIRAPPHTGSENLADSFCLIEHHELLDENDGFQEIQRNGRLCIESFESDDESLSSEEDECLLRAVEGDGEEDSSFTFVVRDARPRMRGHVPMHGQERDSEGKNPGNMDYKHGGRPFLVFRNGGKVERMASSGSFRGVEGSGGGIEEKDISPKLNSKSEPEPGLEIHLAEPNLESQGPYRKPRAAMEYRIWADRSGQYRQEMILLGCENNHVLLLKRNGVRLSILKTDLSHRDQEFLTQAMKWPITTSPKELPPDVEASVVPPTYSDKTKPNPNKVRSWLDVTGRYSVDAQLVGFRKGKIVLHKTSGVKVGVIPDQMAKDDLAFAEKELGMVLTGPAKEKKGKVIV